MSFIKRKATSSAATAVKLISSYGSQAEELRIQIIAVVKPVTVIIVKADNHNLHQINMETFGLLFYKSNGLNLIGKLLLFGKDIPAKD